MQYFFVFEIIVYFWRDIFGNSQIASAIFGQDFLSFLRCRTGKLHDFSHFDKRKREIFSQFCYLLSKPVNKHLQTKQK